MSGEVNVVPTLRKFGGGPVEAFLGGGQLKKHPVNSRHLNKNHLDKMPTKRLTDDAYEACQKRIHLSI